MRKFIWLAATLLLAPFEAIAEPVILDEVVAVVDDDVVMMSELNERVSSIYQRLEQSGTEAPAREALLPRVLEQLIVERIQLNMGQRAGVRISDAELNQAIGRLAASQNLSPQAFVEQAHRSGISLAEIRHQLRNDILINRVQQNQVTRRIRVTEQEVNSFLNSEEGQYWSSPDLRLGHILISLSPGADATQVAQAQAKTEEVLSRIKSGDDFRNLAITTSSGQNALEGGDLGWRKATQLPLVFVQAVADLIPGEISRPVRSDAGYHILKLYERRGAEKTVILQHKVRHILIKPTQVRTEKEAEEMISEIRADIIAGASFEEMARKYSEDIGSALSGGDLGWSLPGQFVPEFEQAMNNVALNDVSAPFMSQFGWHILQVTERRNEDFSDTVKKRQAQNILMERKFEEERPLWLQEIREEAYVDIKI